MFAPSCGESSKWLERFLDLDKLDLRDEAAPQSLLSCLSE
jgi:hypothetical protein